MRQSHYISSLKINSPDQLSPSLEKTASSASLWKQLKRTLAQWGGSLLNFYSGSNEPRISRRFDRQGYPYFHIYDPIDRAHYAFSSEEAVRTWLEQRYYQ